MAGDGQTKGSTETKNIDEINTNRTLGPWKHYGIGWLAQRGATTAKVTWTKGSAKIENTRENQTIGEKYNKQKRMVSSLRSRDEKKQPDCSFRSEL